MGPDDIVDASVLQAVFSSTASRVAPAAGLGQCDPAAAHEQQAVRASTAASGAPPVPDHAEYDVGDESEHSAASDLEPVGEEVFPQDVEPEVLPHTGIELEVLPRAGTEPDAPPRPETPLAPASDAVHHAEESQAAPVMIRAAPRQRQGWCYIPCMDVGYFVIDLVKSAFHAHCHVCRCEPVQACRWNMTVVPSQRAGRAGQGRPLGALAVWFQYLFKPRVKKEGTSDRSWHQGLKSAICSEAFHEERLAMRNKLWLDPRFASVFAQEHNGDVLQPGDADWEPRQLPYP